jgi:hypothetical protein
MESLLSFLVFACISSGFLSVAYIVIVAPTLRVRYQSHISEILDKAHDALRAEKIDKRQFLFLKERCDFATSLVEIINPALALKINKAIGKMTSEEMALLQSRIREFSENEIVNSSMNDLAYIIRKSILVNAGCWAVPVFSFVILSKLITSIKDSKFIQSMFTSTRAFVLGISPAILDQLSRYPSRPIMLSSSMQLHQRPFISYPV